MECPTYSRAQRSAVSGQTGREWAWRATVGLGCGREKRRGNKRGKREGAGEASCQSLGTTGLNLSLAGYCASGLTRISCKGGEPRTNSQAEG